jgi:hypothetical protein
MGDDWDEDFDSQALGSADDSALGEGRTRSSASAKTKTKGKKGRADGGGVKGVKKNVAGEKKKAAPKKIAKDNSCFAAECMEKKKSNGKFCHGHDRGAAAMKYQAQAAIPCEIETYNQLMEDPVQAKLAIDDFLRNHCEGRFRKKLIDWATWKKRYGVKTSVKVRENEELMDKVDYLKHQMARGKSLIVSTAMWVELENSNADREGEGKTLMLWVSLNKSRIREKETYVDGGYEEGSKVIKDPNANDTKHLQEHALRSAATFGDSFLRKGEDPNLEKEAAAKAEVEARAAAEAAASVEPASKKAKTVDIADAAPKAFSKHGKSLQALVKEIVAAVKSNEEELSVEGANLDKRKKDALLQSYYDTAMVRQGIMKLWSATTLADANVITTSSILPSISV